MKTACVILNYNDSETTSHLVHVIRNYKAIDYIVVVDNHSTDESYAVLLALSSEKVHVIQTQHNGGYGYGNNQGFKYAYYTLGAKYIAIANPDVEFSEQCFESLVAELEQDQTCGTVAPVSLVPNGKLARTVAWKQPSALVEVLMSSVLLSRLLRRQSQYSSRYLFSGQASCLVDVVPGSFLMVNAEHFCKANMYDEEVFLYCEEKILAWKLAKLGFNTKLVTNQKYVHRHSSTISKCIRSRNVTTQIWLDSKLIFIEKYMLKGKKSKTTRAVFAYARVEAKILSLVKRTVNMLRARLNAR